jgi:hypothetical protein
MAKSKPLKDVSVVVIDNNMWAEFYPSIETLKNQLLHEKTFIEKKAKMFYLGDEIEFEIETKVVPMTKEEQRLVTAKKKGKK